MYVLVKELYFVFLFICKREKREIMNNFFFLRYYTRSYYAPSLNNIVERILEFTTSAQHILLVLRWRT